MKKAKKKTKKVRARRQTVKLESGVLKPVRFGKMPKGALKMFTLWRLQDGNLIDMHAIPGDPGAVSHMLQDILNAYAQAYALTKGGDPDEYTAFIVTHFGELLSKQYPDQMREVVEDEAKAADAQFFKGSTRTH